MNGTEKSHISDEKELCDFYHEVILKYDTKPISGAAAISGEEYWKADVWPFRNGYLVRTYSKFYSLESFYYIDHFHVYMGEHLLDILCRQRFPNDDKIGLHEVHLVNILGLEKVMILMRNLVRYHDGTDFIYKGPYAVVMIDYSEGLERAYLDKICSSYKSAQIYMSIKNKEIRHYTDYIRYHLFPVWE